MAGRGPLQERFLSQYKQDAFFFNNFARCKEEPGLYLDLGAYRPVRWSDTWLLDKCLGWRGACVEADAEQAAPFRTERGCTVVVKAVALSSGKDSLIGGGLGRRGSARLLWRRRQSPFSSHAGDLEEANLLEGEADGESLAPLTWTLCSWTWR